MIKSLMAKIYCLRVEKLFHILYLQIEIIQSYILPSLQFPAYRFVTVPSKHYEKQNGIESFTLFFSNQEEDLDEKLIG